MTVKNTNPITFYCAQNQNDHCQASMVGAINPSEDVRLLPILYFFFGLSADFVAEQQRQLIGSAPETGLPDQGWL
jgi:hypothetical protein